MKGSLLKQILDVGERNKGIGGYLHYGPRITIDASKTYRVAMSDFLLTGGETGLQFLKPGNPAITKIYPEETSASDPRSDLRLAIVRYLSKWSARLPGKPVCFNSQVLNDFRQPEISSCLRKCDMIIRK